jgi:hypothetical protein
MEKLIKKLQGHSGSDISLMQDDHGMFVRKIKNVQRNHERLLSLDNTLSVPKVLRYQDETLDMEYVHGLDMIQFLLYNDSDKLTEFLVESLHGLSFSSEMKDYTETYHKKLDAINWSTEIPFIKEELISRLPKILPKTNYLGDMTLENVLFDEVNQRFVFIDPITSEYDSFVFDIAKLNQDLICKWFLRKHSVKLNTVLLTVKNGIDREFATYSKDINLVILMLLRVLPYCTTEQDRTFILKEINKLWL